MLRSGGKDRKTFQKYYLSTQNDKQKAKSKKENKEKYEKLENAVVNIKFKEIFPHTKKIHSGCTCKQWN